MPACHTISLAFFDQIVHYDKKFYNSDTFKEKKINDENEKNGIGYFYSDQI
jgi:hypothetical protein